MKTKTKIIAILSVVTIAAAQTSITYVNPGSTPDATDGDTIRNAFITCNNDFTYIGGQLSFLNNSLAGLGTTYDYNGMALLVGLNVTNYVRYAVGTNTVGFLGCLNTESNVLQSDITALTNNVDALWGIIGGDGSGLVMPTVATPAPFPWGPEEAPWGPPTALVDYGSQMCFDSYKVPGQGGPGYGWTTGIRSDGFGTLSAYQIQGNLVDAAGNGNWAITDVNQDTVNTPYGGVPPVDITGFVPVSQNNGTWLWTAPSSLTFLHMAFENGAIYSYANAGITYMIVGGNFQASYLSDSYNSTPASGMVATSVGTDGTWQWMTPPTLPSTLNFDGGSITSDGSGNLTATGFRGGLLDTSGNSGPATYVPTANGDGTWTWAALTGGGSGGSFPDFPDITDSGGVVTVAGSFSSGSFSSDRGGVATDGGGDMTVDKLTANSALFTSELWATSLMDNNFSSGTAGSVPTADGDGSWMWAPGGGGGSGGTMNFDGGNITSDGGGDVTVTGTASFMQGQTVIDYGSGGVQLKINGGSGYQSGGAQIDVAGTICMTAGGEVDVGNGGSFTDPSPGAGYDVKCGGSQGGISSIGQINANGGYLINNQTLVDGSGNVTATSVQAPQLQDRSPSSGAGGQVATAQGDGTWLWQTPASAMVTGGGSGNVVYGGPMMFDFDGTTTNITSDGYGNVGLNGITVTNLETVILPDDNGDPPSSYGVQWRNQNGDTLFEAHGYNNGGANVFNCMDYFGTGDPWAAMFSWSLIGRNDNARRCYLNVYGNAGNVNNTTIWDYEPDNGYNLLVHYNGVLQVDTSFNSDANQISSDGSGNLTAQTFNPVSDRARKERIVALSPTNALALALALNDYSWRFKARTNTIVSVMPTNRVALVTNVVVQPASGTEYGPMAQDWHAVTGLGGGTNISMTSMSGLLLGAIQGLAQAQGIFTNVAGARFHLIVNAQTNGFIFVPLP